MVDLSRRKFTQGILCTSACVAGLSRPACADRVRSLVARPGSVRLAPAEYPETAVWGYGGYVPGPVIRVRQGARVVRRFVNELSQGSSVHWHGIRIANSMDGAVGLTQKVVESGETFLYDFAVPDAGTFWYHPHNRSWEQIARGLYGALVVEEAGQRPDVDFDEVLLLDDWRLTADAQIAGDFDSIHDRAHAGRIGNWITVNGSGTWTHVVERGSRMRLRLVNVANARIFSIEALGLRGWVMALDGMPLPVPRPFDRVTLAPAQRADLIVDVIADDGGEAHLVSREGDGGYAVVTFPVNGEARRESLPRPATLPANPVPVLGPLGEARVARLVMEGGAMGSMRSARLNGRAAELGELVGAGKVWALNGTAGIPESPLVKADRGETVRIALVNNTAWPHAMHLHGHHFRQIDSSGMRGPLRDTVLVNRNETMEIAFVADNPGDWLFHCHMLEHSAGGMSTWLRVS